ncbi:hypothetical protein D3C81_1163590 [compost metagenome]
MRRAKGNGLPEALQGCHRTVTIGVWQQQQKLLPPIAAKTVAVAQALLQLTHAMAQHLVTGQVPIQVIDTLEMVEVDHRHGQAAAFATGAV